MTEQQIENLENNGKVIKNVKTANGNICLFEEFEQDIENIIAIEVVGLQDYEENGFDCCDLQGEWVTL